MQPTRTAGNCAHLAVALLHLLHSDSEDGVGAAGVLVHHGGPHTAVLLPHLHTGQLCSGCSGFRVC